MDIDAINAVLGLGTLGFVLAFAYINLRQTEEQLKASRERREKREQRAAARVGRAVPAE
ncbi:hypothetical protein JMM63_20910 [Rhodovulum sulfidophilum]|uniref:Uncharacterized protein n=1 Tax=Rhodovulum sulfidophilum TaxID=35806 RepID=A0A0D6B4Q9_RHOSU|nr:hypothetical protein [Rhodovulum sulfidophilum]MBL3553397.1 hypothetical protein [Rhodovulum sulfidophilum]MBL3562296.1 hypothetical protein [Rhodovulum sulfidophilum]MBL3565939.1 hypothetical protein [Rhodovulum sulfidophilum]MBL3575799.1 hypothetical protein [Rhodovulum sulfidophilum]MBL3584328.1 hypothetical protein [Rhodovulum sulfidophilum]